MEHLTNLKNGPDPHLEQREIIGTESFEHIFYSCPAVSGIISRISEKLFTINVTTQIYFTGEAITGNEKEKMYRSVSLLMLYGTLYGNVSLKVHKHEIILNFFFT